MKLRAKVHGDTPRMRQNSKEIVKLIGMDALSSNDRLKMETARSIREDFLHQLAFHEVDTYTSLKKQLYMMKLILGFNDEAADAVAKGADIEKISALPVREKIGRFKYVAEENTDAEYDKAHNGNFVRASQICSARRKTDAKRNTEQLKRRQVLCSL